MADGFTSGLGKALGEITDEVSGTVGGLPPISGVVAPMMEQMGKAMEGIADSINTSGLLDAVNGPLESLFEPRVEMIDETLETPDGTIVAYSDHDFDDDTGDSTTATRDDASASDVAEA